MSPLARSIFGPRATSVRALSASLTSVLFLSIAFALEPRGPKSSPAQSQTRLLDPLTPEEIDLALHVASTEPRVQKELGPGRQQLIQVQFLVLKAGSELSDVSEPKALNVGRFAAVLFYRYDTDQGVNVVVNLRERSVGGITRLEGRGVPLAREEVSRAFELALLNRSVRALLGPKANEFSVAVLPTQDSPQNRVEGLRVIATSRLDPCYRHRCIELHFRKREGYVPRTSVMVDLSAQKVRIQNTPR